VKSGALCGVLVLSVALGIAPVAPRAERVAPREPDDSRMNAMMMQDSAADDTPAFHSEVPKGPLPPTMLPSSFSSVVVQNAYALAAKVRKLLYQQPCYCHCDRHEGHGSLLDCYAGEHAAVCDTCIREGFYTYEQSRKGKTAAQIRDGIEHGEWKNVDVVKYQTPIVASVAR
jgi:Protein of unknown function with PCYCGC motif